MRQRAIMGCARLGLCVGLLLLVGGCTEWTIPSCEGTPSKTPCVGPCTVAVEAVGPVYTRATVPLAVVIQDERGTVHCQEIKP